MGRGCQIESRHTYLVNSKNNNNNSNNNGHDEDVGNVNNKRLDKYVNNAMWPRFQLPPFHMPHATTCRIPPAGLTANKVRPPLPYCLLLAYAADCASTLGLQIFAAGIIKFTFR